MDSKTREYYPGAGLPFITTTADNDFAPINHFNVPKKTYTAGFTTGMHAVYKVLFAIEAGSLTNFNGRYEEEEDGLLRDVIKDVMKAAEEYSPDGYDRRGAAIGFLCSLSRVFRDHARGKTWRETLMDDIADNNTYELSVYESALKSNADLLKAVTPVARAASPVATQPAKKTRAATTKRASAGVPA